MLLFLRPKTLVGFILLAGSSADRGGDGSPELLTSFEQYIEKFSKSYGSEEEYNRREKIWESNRRMIVRHNHGEKRHSYWLEMNVFADMLEEEIPTGYDKSSHLAWATTRDRNNKRLEHSTPKVHHSILRALPEAVDWRKSGSITTPIKNQGGCGSCWAFAATAALESHLAIQTGKLFSLSMQELVSCAPNPKECGGQGGCTGSTAELAYDFVAKHGVVEEWRFGYQSYTGNSGNCTLLPDPSHALRVAPNRDETIKGAVASIAGFSNLPSNSYQSLMVAVATMGPVVVSVAASGWGLYKGGIYDDSNAKTRDLNHAVVLEGYGTDPETGDDFWLIRNSWGPLWGENGYIRLKRVDPSTLDNPELDCKMDESPADGDACQKDDDGKDVTPKAVSVCGTSGVLFDGVLPVGGHLL